MTCFSTAFTTIISNDLAAAVLSYAALEWSWCAVTNGTSLAAVEFSGKISSAIPNTNNLRVVIRIAPDDGDEPTALDYTTATSRMEEDYAPNLNAPSSTVVRVVAHPIPDATTKATLTTMAAVLVYVHGITDLFS